MTQRKGDRKRAFPSGAPPPTWQQQPWQGWAQTMESGTPSRFLTRTAGVQVPVSSAAAFSATLEENDVSCFKLLYFGGYYPIESSLVRLIQKTASVMEDISFY